MPTAQQQREKLVRLLKELFQLDQPDLNFGFYRIMHAKSAQVSAFLDKDLLAIVEDAFGKDSTTKRAELEHAYQTALETAKKYGAAKPEEAEPVKQAKAALNATAGTASAEADVYDHLYRFFERYYDNGDFLSRRYLSAETGSKAAAFAVPYDGREVYLHWANADQYYIKTSEYFTNFTFDPTQAREVQAVKGTLFDGKDLPALKVHFQVVDATEGEHGNVKAAEQQKRFFLIHAADPIAIENGELVVRFEFRPDPEKTGQDRTWQDKRSAEAVEAVMTALDKLKDPAARQYAAALRTPAPTDKQKDRPLLARYVAQYTARNTMDYFIHKNLGGFLRRELDFYIKNEVVRLDDIEAADAPAVETYLSKVKVLRAIAHNLIDFLAQLENFQKKLWLKKKFVVETNWCITLDRIIAIANEKLRESLLTEIAANDGQREEWIRLFAIDEIKRDLHRPGYSSPLKVEFLEANPHLAIDTALFPARFTDVLLGTVPDSLDTQQQGLLIHGENANALRLIRGRYRSACRCVYIDPPYNAKTSEILYKNTFKHSAWLSMMMERLLGAVPLFTADGSLIVAIDENEQERLGLLLEGVFPLHTLTCVSVVHNKKGIQGNYFSYNHEFAVFALPPGLPCLNERPIAQRDWEYVSLRKWGSESQRNTAKNCFYPIFVRDGQIVGFGDVCSDDYHPSSANILQKDGTTAVYPIDPEGIERKWRYARDSVAGIMALLKAETDRKGLVQIVKARASDQLKTVWTDNRYIAGDYGTNVLSQMGFPNESFSFPKSIHTVLDCISAVTDPQSCTCDFFGGSGTTAQAVLMLNRQDGGNRTFVLAEIANYFDTVMKPRVLKAAYCQD